MALFPKCLSLNHLDALQKYQKQFRQLRRDSKFGGAPHKPVLLLAVLQQVREGVIQAPQIELTPELVLLFQAIWKNVVTTRHVCHFAMPFYHMGSEPFWELKTHTGLPIPLTGSGSVKSLSSLRMVEAYAMLDARLFELMQDPVGNALLEKMLLETYFTALPKAYKQPKIDRTLEQINQQLLGEPEVTYRRQINTLYKTLNSESKEEDQFVRGSLFKRAIPLIYDQTCAISGLQLNINENIQLVDACHIIPISENGNDNVHNGICLTPTLHRAFDRGLLTITTEYRVQLSDKFTETTATWSLQAFAGKPIHLPADQKHYPDPNCLRWHQEHRFLG